MTNLQNFIDLQKRQLQLDIDALRASIKHQGERGSEAEEAIRKLLRRCLPEAYGIGNGFVAVGNELSHQFDIVIYDRLYSVPIYSSAGCGVYSVESVYGVIEVTLERLSREKLETDIKKHAHLRQLVKQHGKIIRVMHRENVLTAPIAKETCFKSVLPPRSFIMGLNGISGSSLKQISELLQGVTKDLEAHIHGLLAIEQNSNREILAWNLAFNEHNKVNVTDKDAFSQFLDRIRQGISSMDAGIDPKIGFIVDMFKQ